MTILADMQRMLAERRDLVKRDSVEDAIRLQLLTESIVASIPALIAVLTLPADADHLEQTLAWLRAQAATATCPAGKLLAGAAEMYVTATVNHAKTCPLDGGAPTVTDVRVN